MHRPSWRWTLLNPLVTVLVAFVTVAVVTNTIGDRWVNEPLHSTMEAAGGVLALTIAALLIWGRELHERPYLDWIAASLLVQGILDTVHAVTSPGATFYWSRTLPTVIGGLLFGFVWLRSTRRVDRALYVTTGSLALVVGLGLLAVPTAWPLAFTQTAEYEPWAKLINQVSAAPYAAAAVFLLREQHRRGLFTDGVFASYALLLALAAGAFGFSAPWDSTWWAFHVLRLIACVVSIGTVVELLQRVARHKQAIIEGRLDAAHQELERERETLRAVIMQAPLPMALYEKADLRVALANDAYLNVTGGRDVRGKPLLEAVPELRLRPTFKVIQEALETGQPRSLPEFLAPLRDAEGKLQDRYFTSAYQPLRSEAGDVTGLIVVGMEVTEQVRARQLTEQYARRMTVLVQASRAFSQAGLERQAIFDTVVSQLVEHSFDSAVLHLLVPGTDRLEAVAIKHRDPVLQTAMQQVLAAPLRVGEGVAGKVAQTGVSVLMPDVDIAAMGVAMKPEHVRFLEQYPIYGFVTVPIRARGQVIGTLAVTRFVKEPRLESEDQTMLEELADRAALAIVDAEQFAALQRTEAAVQAERTKFESLVMQAPVPMAVYEGPEARLVLLNDAGSRIASRANIGLPVLEALPELRGGPTIEALLETYRTGQPRQLPEHVSQLRGPDGIMRSYVLVSSFVPLRTADDKVYGVLASAIDISEQVQAREAVERSLRFAEQFIGMLGHDLRNPLHAIQVAATLLRETSSEDSKRYLDRILGSSKRMSSMVTQLLDLTRTRLGEGILLERKPMDLSQTVDAVVSELELIYSKRDVRRVTRGDTHGNWDADRLAQVVSNLVGNALQHGDGGRPVEVRVIGDEPQLRFEVQSYGDVIPEELLPTIFDPYRRSDARSRSAEGLGLGLYITQQIVLAHGGTIHVRSRAVEGTVFEVVLPRTVPDPV